MDFTPDQAAAAVGEVADEVLRRLDPDWADTFGDRGFDTSAWRAMVDAGLPGLALPTALGGDGLAVSALVPLLRRAGRDAVVTPLLGSVVAARTLTGDYEEWAAAFGDGAWIAIAVVERGSPLGADPSTRLRKDGDELVIDGVKTAVSHADGATAFLVTTNSGAVLVPAAARGVRVVATASSAHAGEAVVILTDVRLPLSALLGIESRAITDDFRVLLAAYVDGLLAGALARTAEHVSTREQFGKPIAAFQAVGQQLADVYIVSRTLGLVTTAAGWRLAEGLDAADDLAIAQYVIAKQVPATLRTMTHLHGGVGVDISYPLHRYFSLAKDLARAVGGGEANLDLLADHRGDAGAGAPVPDRDAAHAVPEAMCS